MMAGFLKIPIDGRTASLVVMFALTGCAPSGGGPSTRYYLIDPVAHEAIDDHRLAIEILDLRIPQYLERFQIANRTTANQLHFSAGHQWGEPLRKNLTRTMARNLARLLDSDAVATPFNRLASIPDLRLLIDVDEFEAQSDNRVHLTARWQVTSADGRALATERAALIGSEPLEAYDYPAMVAQMETLLGELARRVAGSIVGVAQGQGG